MDYSYSEIAQGVASPIFCTLVFISIIHCFLLLFISFYIISFYWSVQVRLLFSLSDRDRKQPEVVSSRKRKLKNAPRRDQGQFFQQKTCIVSLIIVQVLASMLILFISKETVLRLICLRRGAICLKKEKNCLVSAQLTMVSVRQRSPALSLHDIIVQNVNSLAFSLLGATK